MISLQVGGDLTSARGMESWHLSVLPTPLDRGYASRQARRKEKGCHYIDPCE